MTNDKLANNDRPMTSREFYLHQIANLTAQTDRMEQVNTRLERSEARIGKKLDAALEVHNRFQLETAKSLAAGNVRLGHVEKDVGKLKLWDRGIGLLALAVSAIASYFGFRDQ